MKRNFLAFISSSSLILSLLFACNKKDSKIESNNMIELGNSKMSIMSANSSNTRIFSDAQIDSIGVLHNHYLEIVYNNFDFNNYSQSGYNKLISINLGEFYNIFKDSIFNAAKNIDYNNLYKYASATVISYYDKIKYVTDTSTSLFCLKNGYQLISDSAKSNLQGKELEQVLIMLSVGINSAKFWAPIEFGGIGHGYAILEHIPTKYVGTSQTMARKVNWKEVQAKDIVGGVGEAVGWGIGVLAFGGPVGVGAYIFTVAWGAATSSIM